ncbi:MAG: GxGYxYP family putative glycoside hydrolase, partial [Armatimonadota bacterium]|nr:GxGYxYP family putative glycoside hydrolase [Armatimonadota bacterium]
MRVFPIWCALALLPAVVPAQPLPDWGQVRGEVLTTVTLPEGARFLPARLWEAEEAASLVGKIVTDRQAHGGKAREASTSERGGGRDLEGHVLFGPYIELPPGTYAAFFRVKLLDDSRDGEVVAEVDACVGYGQQILAAREVVDRELSTGKYVQVPLLFRYDGGKLECRLRWTAYASLRVDRVSLFRVEGVQVPLGVQRVPPPQPSGEPRNLPTPPSPPLHRIFAKSAPPAATLVVADVRPLPADWQMLLFSLQGIVNRQRPQIYLVFYENDPLWLDWMVRRGWVKRVERVADARQLLRRYRSAIRGIVVTDPAVPATKNVATMLASVENAIVASPRIARTLRLPVVHDLRGRWRKNVEAYRWAFETLWGRMNRHLVACSYPDHLALRDYLVANRVFIFWISGPIDGARPTSDPDAEVRLAEQILAKMPPNSCVLSYPWAGKDIGIGEGPGVTLFAEFGKYLVGTINVANLTVHSGIRVARFRQKPAPPPPPLRDDKVYVSLILSDGDNLPVLTNYNFPQLWRDPLRGSFPIGWTISPAAGLLLPAVVDYYYETSSPQDYWLAAVSGVGYTYPDQFGIRYRDGERVYLDFLSLTRQAMAPMDLHSAWVMGITDPGRIAQYAEQARVRALFPDYGRRVTRYEDATYLTARNVPVFHAVMSWRENASPEEQLALWEQQVRAMTPARRPAFLHLFVWNWGATLPLLRDLLQRLGDEYVAVRPDHLATLYLQAMEREQVVVRAPDRLAVLGEGRLALSLQVRNTSKSVQQVTLRAGSGLEAVRFTPERVEVSPAEVAEVRVEGVPRADAVLLALEGAFGRREVRIPVVRVRAEEVIGDLPPPGQVELSAFYEAEALSHLSGEEVTDPAASGGKAWSAVPGRAYAGHVVYGPYAGMPAGRYLVLFRLKRTGEARGALLKVDTCVGGGSPTTAERTVQAEELPLGEYRYVALMSSHPGGAIETRVEWFGNAGVLIDHVSV